MGLGLIQYLPILLYSAGIICAVGALFFSPIIGIFFLFPLLPFTSELEKIAPFALGKEFPNIFMLILLIGWFFRRNADKNSVEEKTDLNVPVFCLILSSLIGFINGMFTKGFTIDYLVTWKDYMYLPLIWFLTAQLIRDKKTLKYFTVALMLGYVGINYMYFSDLRWMNLTHFSEKSREGTMGVFVYLGANHYAAFATHFFFIVVGLFLFIKSKLVRIALLLIMSLALYNILYSYSRGAYLAMLAGILVLGVVKEKKILLIIVVFLLFWKSFVPPSVVERVEMTRSDNGQLEVSAAERLILWQRALNMFKASPLYGQGFGTFEFSGYKDTHNYYLLMLAEQGIIGLITFVYLLLSAMRMGWKLYRQSNDTYFKAMGLGFTLCIVSVLVTNLFGNRWGYLNLGTYLWAFMGIVTRAMIINRTELAAAGLVPPTTVRLKPRRVNRLAAKEPQ
jgi:O-antigen ligase